jgi:hypothetical protein
MATKAQRFRYEAERNSKPKKSPRPARPPKRRATDDVGARNLSLRADKKATVATEESHSGRPSRKSGRPSAHRGKNSTVLEYVARIVKSADPHKQHDRR